MAAAMWPRGSRSAQQPAQQQVHILDRLFRAVVFNNFFRHGLGPADDLERLLGLKRTMAASLQRDTVLVDSHVRNGVSIDRRVQRGSGHVVYEGHFTSPLSVVEPSLLQPNEQVRFQLVLPSSAPVPSFVTGDVKAAEQQQQPPVMLHLASTGDHGFWRRRLLHAIPLAQRHQVGSLILETPLYGARRPKAQLRSNLRYVSDLYTMGLANIFEAVPMMHWLAHHGMGTLGVGGFSMGGYMAAIVATVWPRPLGLVSFLGPSSASGVFCHGLLSNSLNWKAVRDDFLQRNNSAFGNPPDRFEVAQLQQFLDEVTAINTYAKPVSTKGMIIYAGRDDGYVPLADMLAFQQHWPGVDLRFLDGGHVSGFLFHRNLYIAAVVECLQRVSDTASDNNNSSTISMA